MSVISNNFWRNNSSFKTTIEKSPFNNNPKARQIVKLIKLYKERNNLSLPSVVINQSILSEIKSTHGNSITENLLDGMHSLASKLSQKTLMDNTNSNNNLNSKLDAEHRAHISSLLYRDIERIENNPRYLKEIFV